MSVAVKSAPAGGAIVTRSVVFLFALAMLAGALIVWRAAAGLGATTAMNDGYPWGLWIAFDVVTGTALGCGGYAVALLVYLLNDAKYHPLVRPAMLTSALGYSIAGFSVMLDLGRPWLAWKIPVFVGHWNPHSVLLEVALCIMAYCLVLWIELTPAFLEKGAVSSSPRLRRFCSTVLPKLRHSMVWIMAAGVVLPTMHQSSLGSLLLLSGPRLHPLWNTPVLPLLFLTSCVVMGFGAVVLEGVLSARYLGRKAEGELLAGLGRAMLPVLAIYLGLRIIDLALRRQFGALFALDINSVMSLVELAMFAAGAFLLSSEERRRDLGTMMRAAILLIFAGALYRFDVFLLAFRPGPQWSYFPNLVEILITVGLVAGEIGIYIVFVRIFPILAGAPVLAEPPSFAGGAEPPPVGLREARGLS